MKILKVVLMGLGILFLFGTREGHSLSIDEEKSTLAPESTFYFPINPAAEQTYRLEDTVIVPLEKEAALSDSSAETSKTRHEKRNKNQESQTGQNTNTGNNSGGSPTSNTETPKEKRHKVTETQDKIAKLTNTLDQQPEEMAGTILEAKFLQKIVEPKLPTENLESEKVEKITLDPSLAEKSAFPSPLYQEPSAEFSQEDIKAAKSTLSSGLKKETTEKEISNKISLTNTLNSENLLKETIANTNAKLSKADSLINKEKLNVSDYNSQRVNTKLLTQQMPQREIEIESSEKKLAKKENKPKDLIVRDGGKKNTALIAPQRRLTKAPRDSIRQTLRQTQNLQQRRQNIRQRPALPARKGLPPRPSLPPRPGPPQRPPLPPKK